MNMTTSNIFEEDEVILLKGTEYKCGLVCSEYIDSDNNDDDENDLMGYGRVRKGTISVAWHPDGIEEIVPENQVTN